MERSVDVAIIGAGQAGLATSWYLKQAGVEPVVLEALHAARRAIGLLPELGRFATPGLYFMGVPWMRKVKSAILYGVAEDAQLVAQHIIESRA